MNAVIAIKLWAPMLRNHLICLQCDNSAAVSVLQTGWGRASFLLSCAHEVRAYTAQYKFEIRMEHIAGANNTLADQLSRYHPDMSCRARVDALIASTETILHLVDAHLFKLAECFQDVWSLVWITHFVTDIITLSLLYCFGFLQWIYITFGVLQGGASPAHTAPVPRPINDPRLNFI